MINWEEIELKGKTSGQIKTKCPACIDSRTNKADKSLSVNIETGVGKCHYCEDVAIRDTKEIEFTLPSQDWKNYTNLSDRLVKWVENERKISQKTLNDLKVTEEKFYQPALQKEVSNITFNYFEGDKVVNKKYRSANKKFTQSKDGKSTFYNINSIIGETECYIVEGEFDVLAMHEIGFKNVISVPNGANDNDKYFVSSEKYLRSIERFIICTDNDSKGIELREKISHRLGKYRCEYIEFENKDANGDLIAGVLNKTAYNKIKFPVSGTFTISDVIDDVYDLYDNGLPKTIKPKHPHFNDLNKIFSVYKGQLTVITGIPSHGKSTFTEWYGINILNDYNTKGSFYSPEHNPLELYQTNFIQKFHGKNFWKEMEGVPRVTKKDVEEYIEWANERLYFLMQEKGIRNDWDWLLNKFKEHIYCYGTKHFFIDAFNKVLLPKGQNKKDAIDMVLTELTNFCTENDVNVYLVAHPTKMRKNELGTYDTPSLYDVSGSADFRNQTHNGYVIQRVFGEENYVEFTNLKTKFSFQGNIGETIQFDYHIPSGRYYPRGQKPFVGSLAKFKNNELEPIKQVIEVNKYFDDEDCPF